MKRISAIIFTLALFLCACGKDAELRYEPDLTASELAQYIIAEIGRDAGSVQYINDEYEAETLLHYVSGYYGLTEDMWSQCAIYRSQAAYEAFEISVFKLTEQADINTVFNELEEYRHGRHGDFFGYEPIQANIVDGAIVSISSDGVWAAVLICEDPRAADEAFFSRLGMTLPEEDVPAQNTPEKETESLIHTEIGELPEYWEPYIDPEIDDMSLWDNSVVVAAIKSGDASGLDEEGKKLFDKVNSVLGRIVSDDMSSLEKERAVYEWLCANCEYDHRHYEVPNAAPRISYEPYGAIVEEKAVCLGYATAFQLFMDVLDIECITVVGAAFGSSEDHAWNMVKIDGEWYCVDATWDEGVPAEYFSYFNRSSEIFAMSSHQWDYVAYPIAIPESVGEYKLTTR